jgi:hypothetical protein
VARLFRLDPSRLTFRVFNHWSYRGIVDGIEAHNKGRQGHNRNLHIWRWEYYMYKFLGTDWITGAFDRENWNKNVQEAKYRATKGNTSL